MDKYVCKNLDLQKSRDFFRKESGERAIFLDYITRISKVASLKGAVQLLHIFKFSSSTYTCVLSTDGVQSFENVRRVPPF